MTAHSSGDGASWNETVDVDQPHGLDYREVNDVRIGVRKRLDSGHTTFADNTVGGVHMPGGAGILGMEITNAGGDITSPIASDGTYQGRGIIWAWDGSQEARLWCSTEAAESTAATDWTVVRMHPDKQWAGGDVTWSGTHQFDVSVTVDGVLDCSTVNVDGTASSFGGSAGIGLFYDPTNCTGGESVTLGNNMIIKNATTVNVASGTDISFAAAFPNAITSVTAVVNSNNPGHTLALSSVGVTGFQVNHNQGGSPSIFWQAMGY